MYIDNPDFNFFVEIDSDDLEKSSKKTEKTGRYDNMTIQGIASDSSEDTDSEILEPKGFQLDRFRKIGFLNYDHKGASDPRYFIGEPVDARIVDNKFFVKAKMYKQNSIARNLWDTMIMLKASNSSRKVGFSIEGKALERDTVNPKRITKALITGLAATLSPKNGNSYADIVKGHYSDPLVKEYEYEDNDTLQKAEIPSSGNGGEVTYLVDIFDKEKGLRYTIDKDLRLKVEKAISTQTAQAIIKESLDKKLKKLSFGDVKKALNVVAIGRAEGKINDNIFEKVKENMDIYKKHL